MTKAPIHLQELRRRIYRKAKSDKTHRFWGLFVHVTKIETLEEAYRIAKSSGGAAGVDGQKFSDIESAGRSAFLASVREDLITDRYKPMPNRRGEIPEGNGKGRTLPIPFLQDPEVLHLVKQIIKVGGKVGVPQGGPFSPLAANIYLNEVDWFFDAIRRKTAEGDYEAINYHRFADDVVITVSGHHTKRGWAERALQRLQEQFALLGVELNREKTRVVDMLKGEAFGFLGFDLRRVRKRKGGGHFILMSPKKKARASIKAKVRDIIRRGGATPMAELVKRINATLGGWV